jgi:hypothetical protein
MMKFNSLAHIASFVSRPESNNEVIATGLDEGCKHFYNEGRYIGTRFSDDSAVKPLAGGGCVVFLGTFPQEG